MWPPRKILFPVDFSERSINAALDVRTLGQRFHPEITLVYVLTPPVYDVGSMATGSLLVEEAWEEQERRARQDLADFAAKELPDLRVETMVLEGDAARAIVDHAHCQHADLIVMATHGYGQFRRFILGSVTAKVLHDADCPVWTGVHAEQAIASESQRIESIVCALDLKPHSVSVLEWAQRMTAEYQAALHVVHAVPAYETRPANYFDTDLRRQLVAEGRESVRRFLDACRLDAAIDVEGGDVAHVVSCAAQRFGADLVVIGRSSETGLVGRLRANAYSIIRQSPCPVLSV